MVGLLIVIVSTIAFALPINGFPLRNWDEAWYAEIIKNMASGKYNLLVPFWNGQYYFDKPPLYFWLSLPIFKLFGPGEWQARAISVIASAFSVFLVYLIGKRIFNFKTGLLSSLFFVTLGQVYVRFSHGNLDALLVALSLGSFYFFLLSSQKSIVMVLSGICLGFAYLAKGWFLGIYPLGIMVLYSLFVDQKMFRNLVVVFVLSIILSGWYFVLGNSQFGKVFVGWYILNPTSGQVKFSTISFSQDYISFFRRDIGLWFIPLVLYLIKVKGEIFAKKEILTLGISVGIYVLSLGFLSEKQDWYLLPVYPYLAILIGFAAAQIMTKKSWLGILILLVFQLFIVYKIENYYPDRSNVGALLGQRVREIARPDESIVLTDKDFTSFLYYSNHKKIYVTSREGGKDWEWWWMKNSKLLSFIKENSNVLIVAPIQEELLIGQDKYRIVESYLGYQFLRFSN